MPRLSSTLNSNIRYRPFYRPITAQCIFPPECPTTSKITIHHAFDQEDDSRQIRIPQARVITGIPDRPVVVQSKLDFLPVEEIEIFPRPSGEAGRDFNLEKTLDWQDYETFNVSNQFPAKQS